MGRALSSPRKPRGTRTCCWAARGFGPSPRGLCVGATSLPSQAEHQHTTAPVHPNSLTLFFPGLVRIPSHSLNPNFPVTISQEATASSWGEILSEKADIALLPSLRHGSPFIWEHRTLQQRAFYPGIVTLLYIDTPKINTSSRRRSVTAPAAGAWSISRDRAAGWCRRTERPHGCNTGGWTEKGSSVPQRIFRLSILIWKSREPSDGGCT